MDIVRLSRVLAPSNSSLLVVSAPVKVAAAASVGVVMVAVLPDATSIVVAVAPVLLRAVNVVDSFTSTTVVSPEPITREVKVLAPLTSSSPVPSVVIVPVNVPALVKASLLVDAAPVNVRAAAIVGVVIVNVLADATSSVVAVAPVLLNAVNVVLSFTSTTFVALDPITSEVRVLAPLISNSPVPLVVMVPVSVPALVKASLLSAAAPM